MLLEIVERRLLREELEGVPVAPPDDDRIGFDRANGYTPKITGDALTDRWERELAEGKTPNLDEV